MSALVKMKLGAMKDKAALIRALGLMCQELVDRHLSLDAHPTGRYIQAALAEAGVTRADVMIAKEAYSGCGDLAFAKTSEDVFQAYFDDMDQWRIEKAFKCDGSFDKQLTQYYAAACAETSLKQQGYDVAVSYDQQTQKVNLQAYAYA